MSDTKKDEIWLVFAPFIVLLILVLSVIVLQRVENLQIPSNTIALTGLILIILGVVTGFISLLKSSSIKIGWRILIFVLYFPTVLFSLVIAGW